MDKFLDLILNFINDVVPFWIVKQWQGAIFLRGGVYKKTLSPGFYFKIPFYDEIFVTSVVTTTIRTPTQSLTTKNEKNLVVKGVIKYNIDNVTDYLIKIYDAKDAILDIAQGIIKEFFVQRDSSECADRDIDNKIEIKLRAEVKKYGISIEKYTTTNLGFIRSIRLFNEIETLNDDSNKE